MMLPTQDKELEQEVAKIVCIEYVPQVARAKLILDVVESYGYHKGLPESIEQALNGGDGSYHPWR